MLKPIRKSHFYENQDRENPMSLYSEYLAEIETRKTELGLNPKPIDSADLLSEIIAQIKDTTNEHREDSLKFFIYNTLPGTTPAAGVKAQFLKEIVLGEEKVEEITPEFALELLSHMKGGPSVEVLLDLALSDDESVAKPAAEVLKTQVYLYEADTERLETAYKAGNAIAKDVLESYAKAEFFTKLPEVPEKIEVVTYIAAEGDISTDLLSAEEKLRKFREKNRLISDSPALQMEVGRLVREVDLQTSIYITLKNEYELSKIEEVKGSKAFEILENPEVPINQISPNNKRVLVSAIFISMIFSILLLYLREWYNDNKGLFILK